MVDHQLLAQVDALDPIAPSAAGAGTILAVFFGHLHANSQIRDIDHQPWIAPPSSGRTVKQEHSFAVFDEPPGDFDVAQGSTPTSASARGGGPRRRPTLPPALPSAKPPPVFPWTAARSSDTRVLERVVLCSNSGMSTLPVVAYAFRALRPGTATLTAPIAPAWKRAKPARRRGLHPYRATVIVTS